MRGGSVIVNLSKNTAYVKQVVAQLSHGGKNYSFIDFSGGKFEFNSISSFSARQFDQDNQIEKASIREYVNFVGEFSIQRDKYGRNIRDIEVNNLPVYWLTSFAEKHPFTHWLFAFFFFKGFVDKKHDFFDVYEKILIIIPVEGKIFNAYLENSWTWLSKKAKVVSVIERPKHALLRSCYRKFHFYFRFLLTYLWKGIVSWNSEKNVPLDYMLLSVGRSNTETGLKNCVKNFLQKNGQLLYVRMEDILSWPYQNSYHLFLKQYPNPFKVLVLLIRIYQNERLAKRAHHLAIIQKDFFASVIYTEIYEALQVISLYFNHLWLRNVFSSIESPIKIFYEDEMYKTGRIISSAAMIANNSNIQTVAYQHGNISESHAVYRFCNAEIFEYNPGKKDFVPLPDIFLVWGEYFKRQFLEWFSLDPKRVLVTGNLCYIQMRKDCTFKTPRKKHIKQILWCTTSLEFAMSEFEILRRAVVEKDLILAIRMHPNFNIRNNLRQVIPHEVYASIVWDTASSIFDSITSSDMVVCSGHSTVFIDCIACRKPVVRLFNYSIMRDDLKGADVNVKNAIAADDFRKALSEFDTDHDYNQSLQYLYVENDEAWRNVLKPRLPIGKNSIV